MSTQKPGVFLDALRLEHPWLESPCRVEQRERPIALGLASTRSMEVAWAWTIRPSD